MNIQIRHPGRNLSDYIKYYWIMESDSSTGPELVYPTGEIQMLFHYGKPFTNITDSGKTEIQPQIAVCGQNTSYKIMSAISSCGVIGVIFHPHTAKLFLPCSTDEITDLSVNISDIYKNSRFLEEQILEAADKIQRIKLIEDFLINRLSFSNAFHMHILKKSITCIQRAKGQISTGTMHREFSISERQFERIFRSNIGISPKRFIEIAKFNNAISIISKNSNLTEAAYEAGYYDQSHFIRAFKSYTGMTPGEFRIQSIA